MNLKYQELIKNIYENILHYAVRSNNQYLVEYILSLKVIDVNTETILDQMF